MSSSSRQFSLRKLIPSTLAFSALASAFIALGSFATPQAASEAPLVCAAQFVNEGICAQIAWSAGPTSDGESRMLLQFVDLKSGAKKEVIGALKVDLWMPDMGHGSSPVTIVKGSQAGSYQINEMFFVMAGSWQVRVSIGSEQQLVTVDVP